MATSFPDSLVSQPGVEVHLTVDFSLLSVRLRNNIIRMLETGFDNGGVGSHFVNQIFNVQFPMYHSYDTVYVSKVWYGYVPSEQLDALESVAALVGKSLYKKETSRSFCYKVPKNHAKNILSLKGVPEWDAKVAEALAIVRGGAKVVVCKGKYSVVRPK